MKTESFYIPLFILISDLVLSLPQLNFELIGTLRLVFIPILVLVIFDLFQKVGNKRFEFSLRASFPLLLLLGLLLFQIIVLPSSLLQAHLSGSIKFFEWGLLYLCFMLSMNVQTAPKIRRLILLVLTLIFIATIIQYPILIQRSSLSLSELISIYGRQEDKEAFGLFAAANEDANGLMALFPLILFRIEQASALKRIFLRTLLLIYIPIVLFFNGTRTALFITFPLITLLFYIKFSLKNLIRILPPILASILVYNLYVAEFMQSSFKEESDGGGTLGFRMTRAWIPASTFTFENSPIWGFGSRGWEYVGTAKRIMRGAWETNPFEIIPSHNVYVFAYVCWGSIGLVCYLTFIGKLLKDSLHISLANNSGSASLGKALFCSCVAYCIWAGISNAQIESGWLILFSTGIIISSLKVSSSASCN